MSTGFQFLEESIGYVRKLIAGQIQVDDPLKEVETVFKDMEAEIADMKAQAAQSQRPQREQPPQAQQSQRPQRGEEPQDQHQSHGGSQPSDHGGQQHGAHSPSPQPGMSKRKVTIMDVLKGKAKHTEIGQEKEMSE
jgi:hypothetical protein